MFSIHARAAHIVNPVLYMLTAACSRRTGAHGDFTITSGGALASMQSMCVKSPVIQGGLTHKKLLIRNRGAGNGVEEASFLLFLREKHTTE